MLKGLARLVKVAAETFPAVRTRNLVLALASLDRPQGSAGLSEACLIAKANFPDIDLQTYELPRDGSRAWWSFCAPKGWTPRTAWLSLPGRSPFVSYATTPCLLATGSASLRRSVRPIVSASADEYRAIPDSIAIARSRKDFGSILAHAGRAGIAAIATDAFAVNDPDTGEQGAGRIELPPNSGLTVFSLTRTQIDLLIHFGSEGVESEVIVDDDSSPTVGAVGTRLDASANVLLTAHLCHRAPGANDNASGVAAVIGALTTLRSLSRHPISLLCGAEIVAAAWWAHEASGRSIRPAYVLNADTVAANYARCGASLELERGLGPDLPLAAIVMSAAHRHVLQAPCSLVQQSFIGASDHGLFASARWRPNVASLTSTHDRFNHSALDRADSLDWTRLKHAGTLLASSAAFLSEAESRYAVEMLALVEQWVCSRLLESPSTSVRTQAKGWVAHLARITPRMQDGVAMSARVEFSSCLARLHQHLQGASPSTSKCGSQTTESIELWQRCVEGPFNLFGLMDRLDAASASHLLAKVRANKSRLGLLISLHAVLEAPVPRDLITGLCETYLDRFVSEVEVQEALQILEETKWAMRVMPIGASVDGSVANPPAKLTFDHQLI